MPVAFLRLEKAIVLALKPLRIRANALTYLAFFSHQYALGKSLHELRLLVRESEQWIQDGDFKFVLARIAHGFLSDGHLFLVLGDGADLVLGVDNLILVPVVLRLAAFLKLLHLVQMELPLRLLVLIRPEKILLRIIGLCEGTKDVGMADIPFGADKLFAMIGFLQLRRHDPLFTEQVLPRSLKITDLDEMKATILILQKVADKVVHATLLSRGAIHL